MYYNDHNPPHFHAFAGDDELRIEIAHMRLVEGTSSPTAIRKVAAWGRRHQTALALCWVKCQSGEKPGRIEG